LNPSNTKDIPPDKIDALTQKLNYLAQAGASEKLRVNNMTANPTDYARKAEGVLGIDLEQPATVNQRSALNALHSMSHVVGLNKALQGSEITNTPFHKLSENPAVRAHENKWVEESGRLAAAPLMQVLPSIAKFPFTSDIRPTLAPAPAVMPSSNKPGSILEQLKAARAALAQPTTKGP
jgi:hypothetical protein